MRFIQLLAILGTLASTCASAAGAWQSLQTLNGWIYWDEYYDDDGNPYTAGTEDGYSFTVPGPGSVHIYSTGNIGVSCSVNYNGIVGDESGGRDFGGEVNINVTGGSVTLYVRGEAEWVSGQYQLRVDFKPNTIAPVVTASRSPAGGKPPLTVSFNGSATDQDGQVLAYQWDFDDNGSVDATGTSAVQTYNSAGYYYARLNVPDNDEAVGTTLLQVRVYDSWYNRLQIENGTMTWRESPFYMSPGEWDYVTPSVPPGYVFSHWSVVSGAGTFSNAYITSPYFTMGSSGDTVIRANIAPDTTPPTPPTSVTVAGIGARWAILNISGATDNLAVTGHEVLVNGSVVATSTTNTATVTGLNPSSACQFTVRAMDFAGNRSIPSTVVSATTRANDGPISSQVFTGPGNYVIATGTAGLVVKAWGAGGAGGAAAAGGAGAYFAGYYKLSAAGQLLGIHPGTGGQANAGAGGSSLAWRQNTNDPLSQVVTCSGGTGGAGGGGGAAGTAITSGGSIVIVGGGGGGGAAANGDGGVAGTSPLPGVAAGAGSAAQNGGPGYNNSGGIGGGHVAYPSTYLSRPGYYAGGGYYVPAWSYSGPATALLAGSAGSGNGQDAEANPIGSGSAGQAGGFATGTLSFSTNWFVDSAGRGGAAGTGQYGGGGGGGGAAGGGGGGGGDTGGGGGGGGGGASLFAGAIPNSTASYVYMARGTGQEPPLANDSSYPGGSTGRGGYAGANGGNGAVVILAYGAGPAPTMGAIANQAIIQNKYVFLPVSATNATDTSIMFSATGLPPGLAIDSTTGRVTGTANVAGTFNSVVRAATPYGFDEKTISWSVTDSARPSKPSGLRASGVTSSAFTLTWNASFDNVDITGYEVKLDDVSLGVQTAVYRQVLTALTGAQHKLEVRARDAVGNWSDWSDPFWMQVYTVSINGGSPVASTGYPGTVIDITAGTPQSGYFAGWTLGGAGSIDRFEAPKAKFTIGEGNATLTATQANGYQLLPTMTAIVDAGGGQPGRAVTIRALPPEPNYSFLCWQISGPGYVTDVYAPLSQAVMGPGAMVVNAVYAYNGALKPPVVGVGTTANVGSGQQFPVSNTGICFGDMFHWQQIDHSVDGGLTWTNGTVPAGRRWEGISTWSSTFSYHTLSAEYSFALHGAVLLRGSAGKSNGQSSPYVYTISKVGLPGSIPHAPSNLRVTGTTIDSLTLAWDMPVAGTFSYEVFKTLVRTPEGLISQPGSTHVNIWDTASTGTTLWGLTSGYTYRFKVRVIDWAQNVSNWSNEIEAGLATPPAPPTITHQPVSQTVNVGQSVTFSVIGSSNAGPITYQWRRDSQPISGATAATLTVSNVQSADAGSYSVVVSNGIGGVTSGNATLTVVTTPPPALTPPLAHLAEDTTSSSFLATWSPVVGAIGYLIDVATDEAFTNIVKPNVNVAYSENGETRTGVSWRVGGLQSDTQYHYRVRAVTNSGTSANSNPVAVRTRIAAVASADLPPPLLLDMPVKIKTNGVWSPPIFDGVPDEVIPSCHPQGLTYYIVDWWSTSTTVTFYDDPVNDWWSYRDVSVDNNADGSADDTDQGFTPWWLARGTTFTYLGETRFLLGAEFTPQPGVMYEIYYSKNDLISASSLGIVNGGGGLSFDTSERQFVFLFNPFTGEQLDHGSLYLIRRTFAPAGVQVALPILGDVKLGKSIGGDLTVSGAITIPGDVTIEATNTSASIRKPNVGAVSVSNGQVSGSLELGGGYTVTADPSAITLRTPEGVIVSTAPGGTNITVPGGISISVSASGAIGMVVPVGSSAAVKNAINQLGILLGLGSPNGPAPSVKIVQQGADPETASWGSGSGVILGNRPVGDYSVGMKETNAPPERAIWFTLTVSPPPSPPMLAVDANRDGAVSFDSSDATTTTLPYRFWLNDDDDVDDDDRDDVENVPVSSADWLDDKIDGIRDLEDFARLKINLSGIADAVRQGQMRIALEWKGAPGNAGAPGIKLWRNLSPNGGTEYLTGVNVAQQHLALREPGTIQGALRYVIPTQYWTDVGLSASQPYGNLLFEGTSAGKDQLVIKLLNADGAEIGEGGGVWLDLKNIKSMYERAVATTGGPRSANGIDDTIPLPSNYTGPDANNIPHPTMGWRPNELGFPYQPDPQESQTYIIYVHGWRWSPEKANNRTETVFKRLWHSGYRGRLAALRWPTFYGGPDDADDDVGGVLTFNQSEYRAWKSGESLKKYVNGEPSADGTGRIGIPSGYARNVVAHSMGNFVASEALKGGMAVLNYAMLNAAVSASCYDENPNLRQWSYTTPNTDADPGTKSLAYAGRFSALNTNVVNFCLIDDSATLGLWNFNNSHEKPYITGSTSIVGQDVKYYGYEYWPTNSPGSRLKVTFVSDPTRVLIDPHEVMSYGTRSLTYTSGAEHRTAGSIDDKVNMDALFQFGSEHGAEWDRPIQRMNGFYGKLLEKLRITVP